MSFTIHVTMGKGLTSSICDNRKVILPQVNKYYKLNKFIECFRLSINIRFLPFDPNIRIDIMVFFSLKIVWTNFEHIFPQPENKVILSLSIIKCLAYYVLPGESSLAYANPHKLKGTNTTGWQRLIYKHKSLLFFQFPRFRIPRRVGDCPQLSPIFCQLPSPMDVTSMMLPTSDPCPLPHPKLNQAFITFCAEYALTLELPDKPFCSIDHIMSLCCSVFSSERWK